MKDDLRKPQLRAIQYQHVDGTFELTFGGTFLLMATCFYVISRAKLPDSSLLLFAPLVVFVGGGYLFDTLIQQLRTRVTYPRTGYLAYRQPQPLKRTTRLIIWIGVPVLTVVLLVLLFLFRSKFPVRQNQDNSLLVFPAFFGLLFSGLYAIMAWKIALPRFYLIAAASLLISAGLFVSGVGTYLGMALLIGAMGALLCASGGVTLWMYLRQNPIVQENEK